jgi:hypothetical protein
MSTKSSVTRFAVVSRAVAFTPLSQNSKRCGSPGFAHEQLTHMKPAVRSARSSAVLSFNATFSCEKILATAFDPQPPQE